VSSDSNGSLPVFGPDGQLVRLTIATQRDLIRTFRALLQQKIVGIGDAARLFSTNAAAFYKLTGKGEILPGKDADLVIFDEHLDLTDVLALGRRMVADGQVIARGTFSPVEKN
jgi:beta-aspartyl-dipeptidase (metallo-type)